MNYLTLSFILFVISPIHSTDIISHFLGNNPLYPSGRSIYPQYPQPPEQQQPNLQNQSSSKVNKNNNNAYFHIDDNVVLKTNDLLICKVLQGNDDKNSPDFTVNSPPLSGNTIFYTYLPVTPGSTCFSVKIRAEKNAYLALSENPYKGGRIYDIILGITSQIMLSGIRNNIMEEVVNVPTQGIINNKEFREFIISWKQGEIMVTHGTDSSPFLYYHEPNMYPVNYIGIATFDKPGTWIINGKGCSSNLPKQLDLDNLVTECWPQTKTENSQFKSLIELQKYFLKQMMNDYEHFNKSTHQQNDIEYIEIYKNELKDHFNKAKEIHNEIIINKIKNDINNKEQLNNYNEAEKNFKEIRQLFFQYYGNLQILSNNLNPHKSAVDNSDAKCISLNKKPNHESENIKSISTDEFYQITTPGCFTFKLHHSAGYIRITLTNGVKKSLKALITLDKYSELQTWKDGKMFDNIQLSTATPSYYNITDEYNTYWISWNAQRVLIGYNHEFEGFINTKHAMDFTDLKYVNVLTENEGENKWQMEKEPKCPHDIDIRIDD